MKKFAMQCARVYIDEIKKWKTFSGRAGRREFWTLFICNFILYFVACLVFGIIMALLSILIDGLLVSNLFFAFVAVNLAVFVVLLNAAAAARRLRDIGLSGWLLIPAFIVWLPFGLGFFAPLAGWLMLAAMLAVLALNGRKP